MPSATPKNVIPDDSVMMNGGSFASATPDAVDQSNPGAAQQRERNGRHQGIIASARQLGDHHAADADHDAQVDRSMPPSRMTRPWPNDATTRKIAVDQDGGELAESSRNRRVRQLHRHDQGRGGGENQNDR